MALFICPACNKHSDLPEEGGGVIAHICPHCGESFDVDRDLNVILDE